MSQLNMRDVMWQRQKQTNESLIIKFTWSEKNSAFNWIKTQTATKTGLEDKHVEVN